MRSSSQTVAACAMSDRRLARMTSRIVSSNSPSENPAVGRDVGSSGAITILLEQWYLPWCAVQLSSISDKKAPTTMRKRQLYKLEQSNDAGAVGQYRSAILRSNSSCAVRSEPLSALAMIPPPSSTISIQGFGSPTARLARRTRVRTTLSEWCSEYVPHAA
jgi:hypothetical protein